MRSSSFSLSDYQSDSNCVCEDRNADLVVYFGAREALSSPESFEKLREVFPDAILLGCSTGGQIFGENIEDAALVGVAMSFEDTEIHLAKVNISEFPNSFQAGAAIGAALKADDLAGVFLLADGLRVNGSDLVAGISGQVGATVPLTGGLAGDGAHFVETLVGADAPPETSVVAAVGFYGRSVRIGHGSAGGWDVFGPKRQITRSEGNILYELDGKPALDLYERYLGDEAVDLPGSGLLFPLRIFNPARPDHDIVRTILAVDHEARSMTFAGTIPQGWTAQLMRGSQSRLTEGARVAAAQANLPASWTGDGAAFLVSCIGRRLLMGQRTNEEVMAVRAALDARLPILGFYSYGEVSPHAVSGFSELHNQTMTIMTIYEAA